MNIEISTSSTARSVSDYKPSLPQPSILLKKDHDSWRGSSGFGLANLLNRNNSSSAAPPLPLPKFNLPSLQSFGKPLTTKPDPSMNRSRSILNESSPVPSTNMEASLVETSPPSGKNSGLKVPMITETPQKTGALSARRLAPARLDEEDGDGEVEETGGATVGNIRGGRWSAEEHDRFLTGFRIHGHKWKRVQQVVRTRSVTQVRTHAQKYLLKLAKLNADKNTGTGDGHTHSSSDTETTQTAGSTPEDSDARSPRKKARRSLITVDTVGAVDEEYISAAATTLCFLMRQKIDSLFDSRHDDDEKNLEPYNCYSNASIDTSEHNIESSRKRPYMDFITETTTDYHDHTPEASKYSIEGKQLCS